MTGPSFSITFNNNTLVSWGIYIVNGLVTCFHRPLPWLPGTIVKLQCIRLYSVGTYIHFLSSLMSLLCFPNLRWPAALPRATKSIVINSICKKLLYFLCGYFEKYPGFGKFCCWLFRFVHLYQCRQTFNVVISCHLPADELDKIWQVWNVQTFHHDNIWLYKVQVLMQDHESRFEL